MKIIDWSI